LTVALSRATTLPETVITLSLRHRLGRLEHRARDVDHHLGHAVVVAQVDEQQVPVVALALHPARQAGLLADLRGPQLAAGMGSVNGGHRISGLERARQKARIVAPSQEIGAFRLAAALPEAPRRYRAFQ
jgi:hypothetical protein